VLIARLIWHAALQQCNFRRHVPKWHFCQLCGHWAYNRSGDHLVCTLSSTRAETRRLELATLLLMRDVDMLDHGRSMIA
jgi:hypothetical protein